MELFIDSADIEKIKELNDALAIHGVTTNPSILARECSDPIERLRQIDAILAPDQLLFAQTVSTTKDGIIAEAEQISSLRRQNMYVKIPVTVEGLQAMKECKRKGIGVLATAVFTLQQAVLAAQNGVDYIAPYVNRMNAFCDGIMESVDMMNTIRDMGLRSKIIAASFKRPSQIRALMVENIDAMTVPPSILEEIILHPGTVNGVSGFTESWTQSFGRNTFVP